MPVRYSCANSEDLMHNIAGSLQLQQVHRTLATTQNLKYLNSSLVKKCHDVPPDGLTKFYKCVLYTTAGEGSIS